MELPAHITCISMERIQSLPKRAVLLAMMTILICSIATAATYQLDDTEDSYSYLGTLSQPIQYMFDENYNTHTQLVSGYIFWNYSLSQSVVDVDLNLVITTSGVDSLKCFNGSSWINITNPYELSGTADLYEFNVSQSCLDNNDSILQFYIFSNSGGSTYPRIYEDWITFTQWQNTSYNHKYLLECENMDEGFPFYFNVTLNGSEQIIWTYCMGDGTALYYNDSTTYMIANDTERLPFEVEDGDGTSWHHTEVWQEVAVYLLNNADDSLENYNLTTNAGTQVTGKIDGAYEFTGSESNGLEGSRNGFSFTGDDVSISFIMKIDSFLDRGSVAFDMMPFESETNNANPYIRTYVDSEPQTFNFRPVDSDNDALGISLGVNTGWYIFTGTTDISNNNITLYLNTSSSSTTDVSFDSSMDIGEFMIGTGYDGGLQSDREWDGMIDSVRIWNRTLTRSEHLQIYNNYIRTTGYGTLGVQLDKPETSETPTCTITSSTTYTSDLDCSGQTFIIDSASAYVLFDACTLYAKNVSIKSGSTLAFKSGGQPIIG